MRFIGSAFLLFTLMLALSACNEDGSVRVGEVAPKIQTKTLADVDGDFSRITTYRYPDKRMYKMSLDQAMDTGKPIVLAFATPGHCTVCDQQLQMLKAILDKYAGKVVFLHMDQYENPEAFRAFKVLGDPWTYIIDQHQVVRFKRAGRMLYGELDAAIKDVL
jgi:thiol-disulfide isomerase/thioredoxin